MTIKFYSTRPMFSHSMSDMYFQSLIFKKMFTFLTSKCLLFFNADPIGGLRQERHNSIANALELRLSCTNPSIYDFKKKWHPLAWLAVFLTLGHQSSGFLILGEEIIFVLQRQTCVALWIILIPSRPQHDHRGPSRFRDFDGSRRHCQALWWGDG